MASEPVPVKEPESKVDRLKAEGNALHRKGAYDEAYAKYSEAIEEDKSNAILYANRAATCLELRRYMDASSDAKMGIELSPKYSKAWARLARAYKELAMYDESVDAWNSALATIPREDPTPSELDLKHQIQDGLEATIKAQTNLPPFLAAVPKDDSVPWLRALAMEKDLQDKQDFNSSAWVIMNAYRDFSTGVETMKHTKVTEDGWEGTPNALDEISNGILRDPRVFHMDTPDWFDLLANQVSMEITHWNGWSRATAETVKEEALKRLESSGWFPVRRALSVTVRSWFVRAYMCSYTEVIPLSECIEYYERCIDVLDWGRKIWKDVPTEKRGVIFEDTLVRGIKRIYMLALIKSCVAATGPDLDTNLEKLLIVAQNLIEETEGSQPKPGSSIDWGFYTSFYVYPIADAFSAIGFYHMQTAMRISKEPEEILSHYRTAASFYIQAGKTYREDDEYHAYFLKIALEAFWKLEAPLSITLPLCERVRNAIPKMKPIWEFSQMASIRDKSLLQALSFEENCRESINEGTLTMDDVAIPSDMTPALG